MLRFKGKRAIVTGGSSGIGKEIARELLRLGSSVALVARGEKRLSEAAEELGDGAKSRCLTMALDIADRSTVQESIPRLIDMLGGLDLLINNAGISRPGHIMEMGEEVFEEMMRVNYLGAVWVTRATLPHFFAGRGGHICTVSSLAGQIGIYGYTAYSASKFALSGFVDCLRQELLPWGVGVSLVFPPDTKTPQLEYEEKFKPPQTRAVAGKVRPLSAEEVAAEIVSGIRGGRYHIHPGASTKFADFMYRHFPSVVRWTMDAALRRYQRDKEQTVS